MLLSVIIPMYNGEMYIRKCLDSIIMQDFSDYEIILVDDGSKDRSGQIADEYAKRFDCLKVIHKSNGGQSSARNIGLASAIGEYVLYLDSDDFYLENDVFSQIANKCENEPDIVAFKYKKYFERSGNYGVCEYSFSDIVLESSYTDTLMSLIRKDAFFCSAWSKAVKRRTLINHHILFDESSRCEDMDWYYQVILASTSIAVIDEVMIGYRQSDSSVTATSNANTIDQFIAFFDRWMPRIEGIPDAALTNVLRNASAKLYTNLLVAYSGMKEAASGERYAKIKKYAKLLEYRENPRVYKIRCIYRAIGFKLLIGLMSLISRLR